MSKFKKISMAVVATVMAGAMIVPLAACGGGTPNNPDDSDNNPNNIADGEHEVENGLKVKTKDGVLDYASGTEIKTSMGYDNAQRGLTYNDTLLHDAAFNDATATSVTFAGKTYVSGNLKPAWQALQSALGVTITDDWVIKGATKASSNISTIKNSAGLASYGLITASADTIVTESVNGTLLDLNKYLDYMPNYKAFLESNDVVRLSVTADTDDGAMYLIPYFDGNDDIEKYVLMRKDIVEALLDATDLTAATGTFASQATAKNSAATKGVVNVVGTQSSVKSFMGTTANDKYEIDVTDPAALDTSVKRYGNNYTAVLAGHEKDTVTIVVDYGKVIEALQDSNSNLYTAVKAALKSETTVQTTSGNIVDIQNQIINDSQGACTGAQLTKVLQEYIKVAYHKKGETSSFYTTLSDVFNSAYAAWDVDLYVALGRCAVTSSALLGDKSQGETAYMLGSRTGKTNRTYDVASMAGELYGVRGLTSRYANLYTYVDSNGVMQDARAGTDMWNALANMHNLALEGLYYTGQGAVDGLASIGASGNTGVQFYSSTDYVQTQTAKGGFAMDGKTDLTVESGYNYAPILTPVSRWDVDGDNTHETVMRFTESWRGVKDGGLCIPKDYVKNNSDRLSAVLALVDWMYSNDGQMVLTYGPFSEAGNITRTQGATVNSEYGTWYATPVTGNITGDNGSVSATASMADLKAAGIVDTHDGKMYYVTEDYEGTYFCYNNKLYTGTLYNGKQVPVPTDEVYYILYNCSKTGSFTDMARWFIGSALNFGNKDQGFEAQCTAQCGLAGAEIWAIANVNGTIKHTNQAIDSTNWWYTLSPTMLPFSDAQTQAMSDQYKTVSGKGNSADADFFYANSAAQGNLLTDIMYYGFAATENSQQLTGMTDFYLPTSAQGVVDMLNGEHMNLVDSFMQSAWSSLKAYYIILQYS